MMRNISKTLDPNMGNSELARALHPRIFNVQVNDDLSVNLLPFLLMLKLAFFLGLILKDALVGTLKDWLRCGHYHNFILYTFVVKKIDCPGGKLMPPIVEIMVLAYSFQQLNSLDHQGPSTSLPVVSGRAPMILDCKKLTK